MQLGRGRAQLKHFSGTQHAAAIAGRSGKPMDHRSERRGAGVVAVVENGETGIKPQHFAAHRRRRQDRKSTRLNSSHLVISYAVFCLKKKKKIIKNMCCEVSCGALSKTNI